MGEPNHPVEQFTIAFLTAGDRMAMLAMAWERTIALAPIELAP
jgi:hypothetical protein